MINKTVRIIIILVIIALVIFIAKRAFDTYQTDSSNKENFSFVHDELYKYVDDLLGNSIDQSLDQLNMYHHVSKATDAVIRRNIRSQVRAYVKSTPEISIENYEEYIDSIIKIFIKVIKTQIKGLHPDVESNIEHSVNVVVGGKIHKYAEMIDVNLKSSPLEKGVKEVYETSDYPREDNDGDLSNIFHGFEFDSDPLNIKEKNRFDINTDDIIEKPWDAIYGLPHQKNFKYRDIERGLPDTLVAQLVHKTSTKDPNNLHRPAHIPDVMSIIRKGKGIYRDKGYETKYIDKHADITNNKREFGMNKIDPQFMDAEVDDDTLDDSESIMREIHKS